MFAARTAGIAITFFALLFTGCTGPEADDTQPDVQKGALPVASSYVIEVGADKIPIRIATHAVRRIDGATVLDWSVTPLADDAHPVGAEIELGDIGLDGQPQTDLAINLIDSAAKKVYRPLDVKESNIVCVCTPWFVVKDEFVVGQTKLLQVAFPELPEDSQTTTVAIRNVPLVSGMPVTPAGQVPTAVKQVDLDASAKPAAMLAETEEFDAPIDHELYEAEHPLRIAINEVVASPDGTSLVYTITSTSAVDSSEALSGKPIHDSSLAPTTIAYKDTVPSGPGVRASDAGPTVPVLRSWFANASQNGANKFTDVQSSDWRECLCTDLQSYATSLEPAGGSVTLVQHLPALAPGTKRVDVVFPDDSVPTLTDLPVSINEVELGEPVKAESKTWSMNLDELDFPEGWTTKQWPSPLPTTDVVERAEAVVDRLMEFSTTDIVQEREESVDTTVTLDSTVSFKPDSARLTDKARSAIAQLADDIDADAKTGSKVRVGGHVAGTDKGSKAFQRKLSQQRADAVSKALEAAVTADVTFSATGFGAEKPLVDNDSEENRKLNRRVVVSYLR